eukprot:TRINITY_DN23401_c0_g1_i1.p1 TRINITY_DN23401_c0_g1~~TRINITY_DN23401_c0_g1_i1.p1  ORF type:complete len:782 (-),score=90.88 TRINITY_DN23401_c0_g1_i1:171-2216(-)
MMNCGNPHSGHSLGKHSSKRIAAARQCVKNLLFENADDYTCVFTAGATAALKLVADCFPWTSDSLFVYSVDSHDSARGIGTVALSRGAKVAELDLEATAGEPTQKEYPAPQGAAHHLFTFPAENNVTGAKHDVKSWVQNAQQGLGNNGGGQWHVCLDAAKLLTGKRLVLDSEFKPDFIVMSFYKIVGAPTGLGALLVRDTVLPMLVQSKAYYGGGSAVLRDSLQEKAQKRNLSLARVCRGPHAASLLEDGTLPFQQISLLVHSLKRTAQLGKGKVEKHAWSLRDYVARRLEQILHTNRSPCCKLYGPPPGAGPDEVGATLAFNLLDLQGKVISHDEVGRAAAACALELRWGAFCNRGALKKALLTAHGECGELMDPCWQPSEVSGVQGCLTGALRVSFGLASSMSDANALIQFVENFALKGSSSLNVKNLRRARFNVHTSSMDETGASLEASCGSRKRTWQAADAHPKRQRGMWCRRIQATRLKSPLHLVPEPKALYSAPGDKDALPLSCGQFEERLQASLRYPDACCAVRGGSIPALCWYLHDQRHKHSVEHEYMQAVFGGAQGRTVLMVAAAMGRLEMVEILLDVLGADVNRASSTDGDTALHRAACKGHPKVCEKLLKAGADSNLQIRCGPMAGWTPLRVAEWKASGDRFAHPEAHRANFDPPHGGDFEHAALVLRGN